MSSRHAAVSFNTSWLEDLYEEHVLELSGDHVTPMVSNPGRIMLTSSRLYYQPYNNVETEPVLKVALDELRSVLKRRYMLRHTVRTCTCMVRPREGFLIYVTFYQITSICVVTHDAVIIYTYPYVFIGPRNCYKVVPLGKACLTTNLMSM